MDHCQWCNAASDLILNTESEQICFCKKCFTEMNNASAHKIHKALEIARNYGGIDGSHHKDWVIDQMVRMLTGQVYEDVIKKICNGEDGPNTYYWDVGIAP